MGWGRCLFFMAGYSLSLSLFSWAELPSLVSFFLLFGFLYGYGVCRSDGKAWDRMAWHGMRGHVHLLHHTHIEPRDFRLDRFISFSISVLQVVSGSIVS
jgi:hypothetical protein